MMQGPMTPEDKAKWMADAVHLVDTAGIGPLTNRDVGLLMVYRDQGYLVATAVKSAFQHRFAIVRKAEREGRAISFG